MTEMATRETHINFILSIVSSIAGLAMWAGGLAAHLNGWFLPEYARAIRGSGGSILLVGLIWLMLTAIRPLPALWNLALSGVLALAGLVAYMAGAGLKDGAGSYLKDGGLAILVAGAIWLVLSLVKLMVAPPARRAVR